MSVPLDRRELLHHLVVLQGRVDQHFAQAQAREPTAFACAPGCANCCQAGLSVFEIEAEPIRQALRDLTQHAPALRQAVREQARQPQRDHCAMLIDRQCSIYDARPTLCRAHGLATLVNDDTGQQLDHCPLNYVNQEPQRASMLVLDAVNQPLAMLGELWRGTSADASLPRLRVTLDELALEPI